MVGAGDVEMAQHRDLGHSNATVAGQNVARSTGTGVFQHWHPAPHHGS